MSFESVIRVCFKFNSTMAIVCLQKIWWKYGIAAIRSSFGYHKFPKCKILKVSLLQPHFSFSEITFEFFSDNFRYCELCLLGMVVPVGSTKIYAYMH